MICSREQQTVDMFPHTTEAIKTVDLFPRTRTSIMATRAMWIV
ncbi:hypothetical protein [Neobacillus novalis]|nr:hypothetical protein [Neobacillus novalis]